jgi:adenylosuccinate synthase
MSFEHGMESMQEFAHDDDQRLHFEFATGQQMLIEGAQVRVVLDGDQGGHKQSMT